MGNSSSSLPFSVDQQVGAPHDHNGWALHKGKSTDSSDNGREVSVFVGKKPDLLKTPVDRRQPTKMQLEPALHHYEYCRKLRHPHILQVYATLDTDNPSAASVSGAAGTNPGQQKQSQSQQSASSGTGDLIVVTEPCIPLSEWLLGGAASGAPTPEQLAWGLECVIEGLAFLHTSAKLAHGCVSPQSLYVTPSGDVKLWNFSLVTPVGPNNSTSTGGPDGHFLEWEAVCCPESFRSPERREQRWDAISNTGGVHAMDSFSLGALIGDYWYRNASTNVNNVPQTLQKALQRLTTTNIKMRPRLQPLLKCPVFDTQYKQLQRSLEQITIQPVEHKINLWQNLGNQLQQQTGIIPENVAKYKILPLIITTILTTCGNESMLTQDMYRREILAMLIPLFYIEEHYQDPDKVGKELAPLIAKLFIVPDRGVRSVLLNSVDFLTRTLDKNALNASVFEPLCSGFNDSSPVLRELTLKATQSLLQSLHPPNLEKLSRYLVRLQADAECSLRTSAVVFIAKIAPHLSEVPRQKMLLPAYARSMKDPVSVCRLSALQSLMKSKLLFTKQDLAIKVMPSVMPLLLDPMTDVRQEAFRVVRDLLEAIQQESNRMTELGDPPMLGAPGTSTSSQRLQQAGAAPAAAVAAGGTTASPNPTAPTTSAKQKSGYLSGLSSWMSTSTAATPEPAAAPAAPVQAAQPTPQPPVQQFAATSFNAPQPAPVVDDGWGNDDGDDDGWGDDDDDVDVHDNELAFSNIGGGGGNNTYKPVKPANNNVTSMGGFGAGMDDDPFASLGMKTVSVATKPRLITKKGKLALPKKAPPAKKLTMDSSEVSNGWDDF
uniref:Protein kinase domain-containing protein n=1 Tax=Pseudo-nitzschia australis TaxID=44445 RepID=A0A7S4EN13_9STRA|mmetsp:Transcript_28469/g.59641  ORF Transcript_28469/g.59641 Transcript_28469/m.59641 type:complete len:829 (-) Transcript_28469:131-2617(-)|eukprot:CAMPEP_0168169366 /NCGR_PEP_ID=MMETSP0139_2-20121125/3599_1 /TAXON_ID=44445 /ORGANISM="Pseudo-nitzschia australis, Strain 10249 10 AB" /LENGTH=828 /DNA_ID=CAMNT_0008086779 /DNA_START=202 /DNA_END=2688 /DNA_ORIENTATION=-